MGSIPTRGLAVMGSTPTGTLILDIDRNFLALTSPTVRRLSFGKHNLGCERPRLGMMEDQVIARIR